MDITTCDLYEGSYYILNGCELESIQGCKINGNITCKLTITGFRLTELQLAYLKGEAEANLFGFRRTYSHLTNLVCKAKVKYKKELNQKKQQEAGAPSGQRGTT